MLELRLTMILGATMSDVPNKARARIISFSGIDGAGKTTQIATLYSSLENSGRTVQLVSFWDDVATLKWVREDVGHKIFKGDKGIGTPEIPIHRKDKNVRSPLMSLVRMALYLVDAISLRKIVKGALRSEADVVIFDRYMYDELANLNMGNAVTRLYQRGIMRLVPRPEISFILDANPVEAFARKPEYPLEFLHSNRNAYLALSKILGGMTVIPVMPIDKAKAEIEQFVFRKPFDRDLQNPRADPAVTEQIS